MMEAYERVRCAVFDDSPMPTHILNSDGVHLSGNAAFYELLGRSEQATVGVHVTELIESSDLGIAFESLATRMSGATSGELMLRYLAISDRPVWVRIHWVVRHDDELGDYIVSFLSPISLPETEQLLGSIESERAILRAALEASPDGMAILQAVRDEHGVAIDARLLRMNRAGRAPSGKSMNELAGRLLADYFPEAETTGLRQTMLKAFNSGVQQSLLVEVESEGGWVGAFDNVVVPIDSEHVIVRFSDVTRAKMQERRLQHAATHDWLTGLPNRVLLQDRLEHALERTLRSKSALACVFIDLDGFKEINDRYGHRIGDEVIREMGQRLRMATRNEDTVSRLGGDEFVLVLENCRDESDWLVVYKRLLQTLNRPVSVRSEARILAASMGVAFARGTEDAEGVLRDADAAMYEAKRSGRGLYRIAGGI